MRKTLLTLLCILFFPLMSYGVLDIDVDDNDKIDVEYGGTNSGLLTASVTIYDPDNLPTVDIPILAVEPEFAPTSITIVDCGIKIDSAKVYSVTFEEWTGPGDGSPGTIETVATGVSDTEAEDDGVDAGVIEDGNIVYVTLPATDVDTLQVWFTFTVQ